MTSKLNFRARTLDASKAMSIYFSEDLPDLTSENAINRQVPALPSGMEKEEEAEKHLQDILTAATKDREKEDKIKAMVIPTPEVYVNADFDDKYRALYKGLFKIPRANIHVQPFNADQDMPDYDMDDQDMAFFEKVLKGEKKFEVSEITFEDMMDRLEKNCGNSAVTLKEAKLLLKEDDDLIIAVFDYWVEKRLRLKQPLIPAVKSDKGSSGGGGGGSGPGSSNAASSSASNSTPSSSSNSSNPYIAFRRRTEKMQTRKNRKNDETSYEKMLKLRRDLAKAVTLLEMVKRREKTKKELLNLTADVFDNRYKSGDFDGRIIQEVLMQRMQLAAQQRILQPAYMNWAQANNSGSPAAGETVAAAATSNRKRAYKKSKAKNNKSSSQNKSNKDLDDDEDRTAADASSDVDEDDLDAEGPFAFKRKKNCQYLAPLVDDEGRESVRGFPWDGPDEGGGAEAKYRYSMASLSNPKPKFLGLVRRRMGRGGRVILDRAASRSQDDMMRAMGFSIINGIGNGNDDNVQHYRPVTPPHCKEGPDWDPYKAKDLHLSNPLPTQPVKFLPSSAGSSMTTTPSTSRSRNPSLAMGHSHPLPNIRSVNVDSVIAHNAASAVVNNDTLDLFSGLTPQPQFAPQ